MKKFVTYSLKLSLVLCAFISLSGCAMLQKEPVQNVTAPEAVASYVVMTYELPFVYEEDQPRQEAFFSAIQDIIAPADWVKGPDQMRAIANILIVSTSAENHLRIERFFASIPGVRREHSEMWDYQKPDPEEAENVKEAESASTEAPQNQ